MELLSRDRTICGGLFAAQRVRNRRLSKPNTVVIRRAGYGALGRLDRVRGARFLRLTWARRKNGQTLNDSKSFSKERADPDIIEIKNLSALRGKIRWRHWMRLARRSGGFPSGSPGLVP